jgi:hypothetical protein
MTDPADAAPWWGWQRGLTPMLVGAGHLGRDGAVHAGPAAGDGAEGHVAGDEGGG